MRHSKDDLTAELRRLPIDTHTRMFKTLRAFYMFNPSYTGTPEFFLTNSEYRSSVTELYNI